MFAKYPELRFKKFKNNFMNITESTDKNSWEEFNRTQKTGSLLQSWDWADFQAGRQQKIWRFEVKDDEKTAAQMFLWKHRFLIGQNGLYCPRGPVVADEILNNQEKLGQVLKILFEKAHQIAGENKSLMFRIDPNIIINLGNVSNKKIWKKNFAVDENKNWQQQLEKLGFKKSDRQVQPVHTIMLDLLKSEDELLKQMHQKTRYNIRLAKKRGVTVIESGNVKEFFKLLKQTTQRQQFGAYSIEYFQDILKLKNTKLYLAEYQGKNIAGILCAYYKNTATYLFGASANEYRNVMAPHLLQWRAMLDAKNAGFEIYDFWGAAPKDSKVKQEKSWQGITRFKQGFDLKQPIFKYFGAYEMVYRPHILKIWNSIYKFYRLIWR